MSYNVAGLISKLYNSLFLNYLNAFDVVFLLETHIEKKHELKLGSWLPDFECHWVFAKRAAQMGRASGGMLIAVRKCFKQLSMFWRTLL